MAEGESRAVVQMAALSRFEPLPRGREQYSPAFMQAQGVVKLRETDEEVTVGLTDGNNEAQSESLAARLKLYHEKSVALLRIDPTEFAAFLGRLLSDEESLVPIEGRSGHALETLAQDAPVVNLVNSICIEAIRRRASDIHLESLPEGVRVRYRIDGVLQTVRRLDARRFRALASRIKVMANLNIMERRKPQDGRTTVKLAGLSIDMRVSCVPVAGEEGAESIVLRIFNAEKSLFGLDELGFDTESLAGIRRLLRHPHGMILVTGPTGSGKSTTLNSMIRSIASDQIKIVTIEDPVEYVIEGVDQIQTDEKIGLSFDTLLRRVLRQDPDVILVGEIRDSQTAALSVRAALTGHLVLSTLHTNDAVSGVARLLNLGVEPYLIAAVLRGVVAQRLVRRLCPACRRAVPLDPPKAQVFVEARVEAEREYLAQGCEECLQTGYAGRFAIAEFFSSSPGTAELIIRGAGSERLLRALCDDGMRPMRYYALSRAAAGETSLAELERAGAI